MNLRTALARGLGMAAVFAVALVVAPPAAEAHAGHVHKAATAVAASGERAAPSVSVDPASVMPDRAVHDHGAAELRTAPDVIPAAEPGVCGQGCCTGAPCHSGAACTLGPELIFLLPHDSGENLVVWNVAGIAGCDPEGIRKPPRTFA